MAYLFDLDYPAGSRRSVSGRAEKNRDRERATPFPRCSRFLAYFSPLAPYYLSAWNRLWTILFNRSVEHSYCKRNQCWHFSLRLDKILWWPGYFRKQKLYSLPLHRYLCNVRSFWSRLPVYVYASKTKNFVSSRLLHIGRLHNVTNCFKNLWRLSGLCHCF